jgi:ketosteroid isomerase-like protein
MELIRGRAHARLGATLAGLAWMASLCASCSSATSGDDLGQRWLDALNSHDPSRIVQLLDADASYWDITTKEPLSPTAVAQRWTREWTVWKDRVYTGKSIINTPDSVVIEWHLQQTHPNGTPVPLDGVTILERDGRRIRRVRDYYNPGVYLQFLKPQ